VTLPLRQRIAVGIGVGVVALTGLFAAHPPALAAALAIPIFLFSSLVADRLFRRYASVDEIRLDLKDQVPTPPIRGSS
jgi:membrane-bound metal-dependent hydrolase YbcI (DUF457 family)